ncbi:MAG TPA: PHP domain-containing protein, partial [Candidatus Krumholzibacteria bacterium]|nr:PHP domain-containing protein [Candidatus Krumholzibacteria bacterium]
MISTAPFVHLHSHSSFSLLRSVLRVPELVRFAADHGMPAIALTDRGNLFGAVEFHQAALEAGVKPIFGMEVSVVRDRRAEDPAKRGPARSLVLLAADRVGWNHLMKISSLGWREGLHDGAPHVDDELLGSHAKGIIALSGGGDGV